MIRNQREKWRKTGDENSREDDIKNDKYTKHGKSALNIDFTNETLIDNA